MQAIVGVEVSLDLRARLTTRARRRKRFSRIGPAKLSGVLASEATGRRKLVPLDEELVLVDTPTQLSRLPKLAHTRHAIGRMSSSASAR